MTEIKLTFVGICLLWLLNCGCKQQSSPTISKQQREANVIELKLLCDPARPRTTVLEEAWSEADWDKIEGYPESAP